MQLKKTPQVFVIFATASLLTGLTAQAQQKINTSKIVTNNKTTDLSKIPAPQVPTLKANQLAIFKDEKYEIFTTREVNKINYSENCFKANKPNCEAYKMSLEKFPVPPPKNEFIVNPAASYCESMSGKNKIVLNSKKQEYDYCLFADGSMTDSWAVFLKHYPPQTVK